MNHVGRQSTKLVSQKKKLDISKALTTMDVKDIVMKKLIANIFSTVQTQNDVEDFPRVKELKIREPMEQRTPDTTNAPVTLSSISYIMEIIVQFF